MATDQRDPLEPLHPGDILSHPDVWLMHTSALTKSVLSSSSAGHETCKDSFALSYVQVRDKYGNWKSRDCLLETLEFLRSEADAMVWLDRLAGPRGMSGKRWATEGLLPYTRNKVLMFGLFLGEQPRVASETAVSAKVSGRREASVEVGAHRNQGLYLTAKDLIGRRCMGSKMVGGRRGYTCHLDIQQTNKVPCETSQVVLRRMRSIIMETFGSNTASVCVTIDVEGFMRTWPFAERLTGADNMGLYACAKDLAAAALIIASVIEQVWATNYDGSLSKDSMYKRAGAVFFLESLRVRPLPEEANAEPILTEGEVKAIISSLFRQQLIASVVSRTIDVYWATDCFAQEDKVSMILWATSLAGRKIAEKVARLSTLGRPDVALQEIDRLKSFLWRRVTERDGICEDSVASTQDGECIRYACSIPGLTNRRLDAWLQAHGYCGPNSLERACYGWQTIGFIDELLLDVNKSFPSVVDTQQMLDESLPRALVAIRIPENARSTAEIGCFSVVNNVVARMLDRGIIGANGESLQKVTFPRRRLPWKYSGPWPENCSGEDPFTNVAPPPKTKIPMVKDLRSYPQLFDAPGRQSYSTSNPSCDEGATKVQVWKVVSVFRERIAEIISRAGSQYHMEDDTL